MFLVTIGSRESTTHCKAFRRMSHRPTLCSPVVVYMKRVLSLTLVFYVTGQQYLHTNFPRELRHIRADMDRIINDKKHIIPKLVEGIFNYYTWLLLYRWLVNYNQSVTDDQWVKGLTWRKTTRPSCMIFLCYCYTVLCKCNLWIILKNNYIIVICCA